MLFTVNTSPFTESNLEKLFQYWLCFTLIGQDRHQNQLFHVVSCIVLIRAPKIGKCYIFKVALSQLFKTVCPVVDILPLTTPKFIFILFFRIGRVTIEIDFLNFVPIPVHHVELLVNFWPIKPNL